MMRCEDCGRILFAEEVRKTFGPHGLALCDPCIDDIEEDAAAYDEMTGGFVCSFQKYVTWAISASSTVTPE